MKKSIYLLVFAVAVAAVTSGCSTLHHEDVTISWNSVPVVVQSTIQAHMYGGTVGEVERETGRNGDVYEATVKGPDGQRSEVKVAQDGKLLKYKACKDN